MSSPTDIRISELPKVQEHSEIQDSDLLAISTSDDTMAVSISLLKILFSADDKIAAAITNAQNQINEELQNITAAINAMSGRLDTDEDNISYLLEYAEKNTITIASIKSKMATMQTAINTNKSNITILQNALNTHAQHINTAENDIANLKNWKIMISGQVQQIEATLNSTIDTLSNLIDDYGDFVADTQNSFSEVDKKAAENLKTSLDKSQQLYDQCMDYFDYYFHIRKNPPNFDEPWYWEQKIAGYAHPLHSVIHVTEANWDPTFYNIPGVWKLVGFSTISDTENIVEYTYERIE